MTDIEQMASSPDPDCRLAASILAITRIVQLSKVLPNNQIQLMWVLYEVVDVFPAAITDQAQSMSLEETVKVWKITEPNHNDLWIKFKAPEKTWWMLDDVVNRVIQHLYEGNN